MAHATNAADHPKKKRKQTRHRTIHDHVSHMQNTNLQKPQEIDSSNDEATQPKRNKRKNDSTQTATAKQQQKTTNGPSSSTDIGPVAATTAKNPTQPTTHGGACVHDGKTWTITSNHTDNEHSDNEPQPSNSSSSSALPPYHVVVSIFEAETQRTQTLA
eukprot:688941-Prorocentrum_lima.AAC.1